MTATGRLCCPSPNKRRYALEETAALSALRRSPAVGHELEPYYCVCGDWHIRSVDKYRAGQAAVQSRADLGAAANLRPWEPWEDELVLDNRIGTSELVQRLGRSFSAILKRHQTLRLMQEGETG